MHGTTTGEDIFNCVFDLLQKFNLPQSKLTSVATDGAPSMTGKTNGFVALLRKKLSEISDGSNIHHTHCIIHQEVLCTKELKRGWNLENRATLENTIMPPTATNIAEHIQAINASAIRITYQINPARNENQVAEWPQIRITASSPTTSEVSFASSSHHRTVKLPKIELKKFTGEIKDWLGWWAQFNKIHVDPTLEDSDKFQYLVQSMSPGTRASKLVDSYPLTAENYPKVIETLTERFGRPELLTSFYDELVTHLRALESLKIESRQMSVFIFPMIEACLSEELMKAWQRSPLHDVKIDANDSTQTRVDLIMEFLQKEAAAEQDRALAGSKFGLRSLKQDRNVGRQSHPAKIPTASGLFAGRAQNCIFRNKDHKNTECLAARRMSIKERIDRIKNAKCCFSCLQPGHISFICRRRITECIRCKKKHLDILCPLNAPGRESADEDKEQVEDCDVSSTVENGVSFSGLSASSLILQQTLMIKVEGATSAKVVRALLDTGSQRSYILSKTAQDLGLSPIGQESLKHVVFGGHTSESVHQEYRVNLGHASGNFKMVAKLLDQQKICGNLPRLSRGPWLKELKARKIWVPDIGKDDMEIEILLGCDVLRSIFMMKSCVLSNGLIASQTRFGWTLMGECQPG
ncbi:hypothetical protein LAZ67_3002576 [Cordylochernes scorpioides]|uniref:Peptidase aspartic putative domain-containing protein n=1 Tax=Cordylochernes scorpioides TaxID=51811 RepID=A0ABY6K7Y5_9ARAC|nr:hypothetical protein LAZ67_3002576 [Cordylochernes scorpioides]